MGKITVEKCSIDGLYVIKPTVYGDERGYFVETYNKQDMDAAGLDMVFVQDNQSMSKRGVLRGLHFQKEHPQGKLVRVIKGKVFDVAVDLRKDSPTYKKWVAVELTPDNYNQLLIPRGCAHGFLTLTDNVEFVYKEDNLYAPHDDRNIIWNDPEIGIEWPEITGVYQGSASAQGYAMSDGTKLNLSEKDQKWLGLKDTFKF